MNLALLFEQLLNGLQYGVMLFLMAAGLTLVLGIMNMVNLAHGSLYMVGAYLAVAATQWTGSYLAGVALGLLGTLLLSLRSLLLRGLGRRLRGRRGDVALRADVAAAAETPRVDVGCHKNST